MYFYIYNNNNLDNSQIKGNVAVENTGCRKSRSMIIKNIKNKTSKDKFGTENLVSRSFHAMDILASPRMDRSGTEFSVFFFLFCSR